MKSFEQVDSLDGGEGGSENFDTEKESVEIAEQLQNEFAMKISNYANIFLLILKVIFFFLSSPLLSITYFGGWNGNNHD